MYLCPSCKQPGIGGLAKRWSSRGNPAKCTLCGRLSHVIDSVSSGIFVSAVLLVVIGNVVAVVFNSVPLALSGICLAVAYNISAWRRAEMFPIYPEQAKAAAMENWIVVVMAAFYTFFS